MTDLPDAATEDDTARDGLLSYAGEWHALTLGITIGLAMFVPSTNFRRVVWFAVGLETIEAEKRSKALRQVREESWYALGGVVLGLLLGIVLLYVALWIALVAVLGF